MVVIHTLDMLMTPYHECVVHTATFGVLSRQIVKQGPGGIKGCNTVLQGDSGHPTSAGLPELIDRTSVQHLHEKLELGTVPIDCLGLAGHCQSPKSVLLQCILKRPGLLLAPS
jgi:hypothetical protein